MRRRTLLWVLPALALAGCAAPPPAPAVLTLIIKAGPNQNPDPTGKAAPVAVRLYQLGAAGKFQAADVFSLIDHQSATLGSDSLGAEQILVKPGQTLTETRTLKAGTQFLGVAVLFRNIDHSTWRQMAPAKASGPTNLTLTINGLIAKLAPS